MSPLIYLGDVVAKLRHIDTALAVHPDLLPDRNPAWDLANFLEREFGGSVHTIPVPRGWSVEQAWEAIQRGDVLTDPLPGWANVVRRHGL